MYILQCIALCISFVSVCLCAAAPYSVLQHFTLCCNVLQCCECVHALQRLTMRCNILQCVALFAMLWMCPCAAAPYSVWQCITACCNVLQSCECVSLRCSALQCVAVFYSVLQCWECESLALQRRIVCCSVLQCVAVHRSVLQYVAVRWSILQLSKVS